MEDIAAVGPGPLSLLTRNTSSSRQTNKASVLRKYYYQSAIRAWMAFISAIYKVCYDLHHLADLAVLGLFSPGTHAAFPLDLSTSSGPE